MLKTEKEQIERAVKALAQLRAHGVRVLFVRLPSDGPYLAYEERFFRARAPGMDCWPQPMRPDFTLRITLSCAATTCRSGRT